MVLKKLENLIKKIFPVRRYLHRKISQGTGLSLDYSENREGIDILAEIFIHRAYADYFPMQQSATVVDVGAHYGFFSFFAALNLNSDSKIHSIEASGENFKVLQKNLDRNNFSTIKAHQIGLSDKSGTRPFYGGPSFNHSFFSSSQKNPVTISTLSLKDFMAQEKIEFIDFLKLDCEGAEFPILLHAGEAEMQKIKTISMEFHDLPEEGYSSLQLIEHLKKHGFEIVRYRHESDYSLGNLNFGKIIATRWS